MVCVRLGRRATHSLTPVAEQRAPADVIFVGRALNGPTATGIHRFRVSRYIKGRGPATVRVQRNHKKPGRDRQHTSVSLFVRRGEQWQISARGSSRKILRTNVCDGSRKT